MLGAAGGCYAERVEHVVPPCPVLVPRPEQHGGVRNARSEPASNVARVKRVEEGGERGGRGGGAGDWLH